MRDRLTVLLIASLLITPIIALAATRGTTATPEPRTQGPADRAASSLLHRTLGDNHATAYIDATTALAVYDWADALPEPTGRARVRSACARLDRNQPLLAALARTCAPALALGAANQQSRRHCRRDQHCAAIMHRRARALHRIAHAERALARAIRAELPPGACRRALAPSSELITADLLNSAATARYARALATGNAAAGRAEHAAMDRAADLAERHATYPRGRTIARACGLPDATFGNATA